MYYGGRPERPKHFVVVLGAATGSVAGLVSGYFGFLLSTVLAHMLRVALPAMTTVWFILLWLAALAVPVLYFRMILRGGRGLGTKLYASCGIGLIALLFAGEISGTIRLFPWNTRFYLVPAIVDPAPDRASR